MASNGLVSKDSATHDAQTIGAGSDFGDAVGSDEMLPSWIQVDTPTDDGSHGAPRTGAETRPVNMGVAWVIKTKPTPP